MQESFEQFNVAFISCGEVGAEKELRGAILVTDKKSHPIELRYTEAVKASALEKLVYGITLKRGITIEKIALPLLQNIETSYSLIVVGDRGLLDLAKSVSTPVCFFDEEAREFALETLGNDEERNRRLLELIDANLDESFEKTEPLARLEKVLEYVQYYGDMGVS